MKFLICLAFIVGSTCAQSSSSFNSAIAVLRELDQTVVPSINSQIDNVEALFGTIGANQPELAALGMEAVEIFEMFKTNFTSIEKDATAKVYAILSILRKNGQIVPSEVVRATKEFAAVAKSEMCQFEKLLEKTLRGLCAIAPRWLNSRLKENYSQSLAWITYLYKLTRCANSRLKNSAATALNTSGNDDADNLNNLATFLTAIGTNLSTFFGGISSTVSDLSNIASSVVAEYESSNGSETETITTSATSEATTEAITEAPTETVTDSGFIIIDI